MPAITLEGETDGVSSVDGGQERLERFTGRHDNRVLANRGHNLPQETPEEFARAVLDVKDGAISYEATVSPVTCNNQPWPSRVLTSLPLLVVQENRCPFEHHHAIGVCVDMT